MKGEVGKPDCSSIGKHPRTIDGKDSATTDLTTIQEWWKRWPKANVGIRTGECSGIVVLDVDGDAGKASLQALLATHGAIPATLRTLTGRASGDGKRKGCHYFFKMPESVQLRNSTGVLGPRLDIRGEGGYVVAAPSKHHSGLLYQWLKKDLPLADVPDWMLAALTKPKLALDSKRLTPESGTPEESAFAEGGRNAGLTSLAGKLRAKGLDVEEMEAALLVANQKRCKPPLPESEVREIARSVGRYEPQQAIAEAAKAARNWPSPLSEAAYHGIAGEFVRLVGPQTEADPAALLFQLLVALGSIIGRGPYLCVGAGRHHVNIFAVCVGYLQWLQEHGMGVPTEPILRKLDNIQHRDAILARDSESKPMKRNGRRRTSSSAIRRSWGIRKCAPNLETTTLAHSEGFMQSVYRAEPIS